MTLRRPTIPLTHAEARRLQFLIEQIESDQATEQEQLEYIDFLERKKALDAEKAEKYRNKNIGYEILKNTLMIAIALIIGYGLIKAFSK